MQETKKPGCGNENCPSTNPDTNISCTSLICGKNCHGAPGKEDKENFGRQESYPHSLNSIISLGLSNENCTSSTCIEIKSKYNFEQLEPDFESNDSNVTEIINQKTKSERSCNKKTYSEKSKNESNKKCSCKKEAITGCNNENCQKLLKKRKEINQYTGWNKHNNPELNTQTTNNLDNAKQSARCSCKRSKSKLVRESSCQKSTANQFCQTESDYMVNKYKNTDCTAATCSKRNRNLMPTAIQENSNVSPKFSKGCNTLDLPLDGSSYGKNTTEKILNNAKTPKFDAKCLGLDDKCEVIRKQQSSESKNKKCLGDKCSYDDLPEEVKHDEELHKELQDLMGLSAKLLSKYEKIFQEDSNVFKPRHPNLTVIFEGKIKESIDDISKNF